MSQDCTEVAASAHIAFAWLAHGEKLDQASFALTLLAFCGVFWEAIPVQTRILLLMAVGFGVIQKYYALRVAFDSRIFAYWANRWGNSQMDIYEADLTAFDASIKKTCSASCIAIKPRGLNERITGAYALFRQQGLWLLIQLFTLLVAGWNTVFPFN